MGSILRYLNIEPSSQSVDYVSNKKQFHLHSLLTEQRHPKTMDLSSTIREDIQEGLRILFSVDEDVSDRIGQLAGDTMILDRAADAVCRCIRGNRKIYLYGCGATGRLAKQMESALWRPFWRRMQDSPLWAKLEKTIPADIGDRLTGEMTGADRALISSLEGFEDLQLIGRLQLLDHGIEKGDAVFCVTEGGETSSVIGTILAALDQYGEPGEERAAEASRNLFFIYNNPDHLLLPFDRSRMVIENHGITKLNLTTGPQAISGSTRMQATTIETFVLGVIFEEAIFRLLKDNLAETELAEAGFDPRAGLGQRLLSFSDIRVAVANAVESLAELTLLETETYQNSRFATYFANKALITVFTDCTERSPTFRLFPIDTVQQKVRKSLIQVWTEASSGREAWHAFLGRDFRGLDEVHYRAPFTNEIDDPFLRQAAMKSLANAGNDQSELYDLSFSGFNRQSRGPQPGDLGVALCIMDETAEMNQPGSSFRQFCSFIKDHGGRLAVIRVNSGLNTTHPDGIHSDVTVDLRLPTFPDPLGLRSQIALKMLLNAHSTAVMTLMGRVAGNTMTNVNPGNLKLIGRATFLILLHVNEQISREKWIAEHGVTEPLTFDEINAVLFEAMDFVVSDTSSQTAEVALSVIRILEALKRKAYVSWDEAQSILIHQSLDSYLS